MTEEQRSPSGKPMVPATPKDVIHIRIGSLALVLCVGIGLLAGLTRPRRQRRLGGGPESRG
ncbi:hypothetical protein GCM10023194_00270 [Planotetraspora phitsanulokensis]|uniref:Uncharacterized protein n=1 Tax=Planotetraspora phitsanulokensis TaxID=575192 RepID=A0A8J3U7L0_9ACTN|nr:hypothetical protein [Planotetraspora phitsanulokensis]GII40058.1 hypothetical protein Pph01_50610 [Planotetraspora phitsanulokensis]